MMGEETNSRKRTQKAHNGRRLTADYADERRFSIEEMMAPGAGAQWRMVSEDWGRRNEGGHSCLSRRRPPAKADLSRREADPPLRLLGGLENPPSVIRFSPSWRFLAIFARGNS